jgi:hypothetical protein
MTNNNMIWLLIGLLITSNGVLSCLLYAKKGSAPTVALVFDEKETAHTTLQNAETASFWNNYPYLVLASEGKAIDSTVKLTNAPGSLLSSMAGKLIYRFFPNERFTATDTILKIVARHEQVVMLTDSASYTSLQDYQRIYGLNNRICLLSKKMELSCERIKRSYFFILSKERKPLNIYFPRREIPQVTEKYVDDNLKRARFF